MYFAEDENFARRLQKELKAYDDFERLKETKEKENFNPIDPKLEYIDPTPSIQDLFMTFDRKFFWNTLGMVVVAWSNQMTRCAGMCSFEGPKGLCKISLSAPLLTLRPRKDLVETLLHEMIHAYLFITNNYKDRQDHGPEFHKHMHRINKIAGTNITVYHTYYEEVEYYQMHVWRCDGPCNVLKPFFGFVKRATNRPPGPNDKWWNMHQKECGGNFVKLKEPEKKPRSKKEPEKKRKSKKEPEKKPKSKREKVTKPNAKEKDIREFFTPEIPIQSQKTSNVKTFDDLKRDKITGLKTNSGSRTLVVTNNNVDSQNPDIVNTANKCSRVNDSGMKLIGPAQTEALKHLKNLNNDNVRETVRNVWANKFSNSKSVDEPSCSLESFDPDVEVLEEFNTPEKKVSQRGGITNFINKSIANENVAVKQCPVCSAQILQSEMNDHIENCLQCSFVNNDEDEENTEKTCELVPCPCCFKWFRESIMNDHIDECLTLNSLKEEILQ